MVSLIEAVMDGCIRSCMVRKCDGLQRYEVAQRRRAAPCDKHHLRERCDCREELGYVSAHNDSSDR